MFMFGGITSLGFLTHGSVYVFYGITPFRFLGYGTVYVNIDCTYSFVPSGAYQLGEPSMHIYIRMPIWDGMQDEI